MLEFAFQASLRKYRAIHMSRSGIAVSAVLLVLFFAPLLPAWPGRSESQTSSAKVSSPNCSGPFHAGERLEYSIRYGHLPAWGHAELRVAGCENFQSPGQRESAWRFVALIQPIGTVRAFYPYFEQWNSLAAAGAIETIRVHEHRQPPRGIATDSDYSFVADTFRLPAGTTNVIVPAGTHDPLSAFYFLRIVDWNRTPEIHIPVYDGTDLLELVADRRKSQELVGASHRRPATQIRIRLYNGKRELQENFELWLAQDTARTPDLIVANLRGTSLQATLIAASKERTSSASRARVGASPR